MSPSELLQKVGELFVTHQAVPKPSMSLSSHGTHRVAASASAPHSFLQPFFTFLHCFLDSVVLHVLNSALQASLQSPKFLATSVSDKHGNGSAGGEGATAAGGGGAGDDEGGGGDGEGGGGEGDGGGGLGLGGNGGNGGGEGDNGDGDTHASAISSSTCSWSPSMVGSKIALGEGERVRVSMIVCARTG